MRKNLPNILSVSRIVLAAVFIITYSATNHSLFLMGFGALTLAFLTDHIDGPLARRLNVTSKEGFLLDGLADRAVYISLVLTFVGVGHIRPSIAWLVIFREVMLYVVRLMQPGEWYPVSKVSRRLAQAHATGIRLWLLTYLAADASVLFWNLNVEVNHQFQALRTALLIVTLAIAYGALGRSIVVLSRMQQGRLLPEK